MTEQSQDDTPVVEQEQVETVDSEQEQTADWEKQYKELQADYTRKSQELSNLKKAETNKPQEDLSADEKQLEERMEKRGFVKDSNLQQQLEQTKLEAGLTKLIENNPDLGKFESALKTIQKVEGGDFEELAIKHGFTSIDKLEKAKASRNKMVGTDGKTPSKQKKVTDMTPDEWEEYKKKHGIANSAGLVGSSSI